jgi:hypothetical protein
MNSVIDPVNREKISHLISEMIYLILGKKDIHVDEVLVNKYIEHISKIDDNNPMKSLLLLKDSFVQSYIDISARASIILEHPDDEII